MTVEVVELAHVYGTKVWVESGITGSKYVVVQSDAPGSEPFTYCAFHYHRHYTSNSHIWQEAQRMALSLGATEPVEQRFREPPMIASAFDANSD